MGGACGKQGREHKRLQDFSGENWKILLGNTKHKGEDNIKMDLKDIQWYSADWIHLAGEQGPLAGFCKDIMTIWVPLKMWEISWLIQSLLAS